MTNLSTPARELVNLIRRHDLSYISFNVACHAARRYLEMKPSKKRRALPRPFTEDELKRFFDAVDAADVLQHAILIRVLLYTGARASELCNIKIEDVDLRERKIFIDTGKGSKDRYVLFGERFYLPLKTYMSMVKTRNQTYLFEGLKRKHTPLSRRWIHMLVQRYGRAAALDRNAHPHLMRHTILTLLKKNKVEDAQIQLISGHESRQSLEIYTHVALQDVKEDYQTAVRKLPGEI